LKKLRIHSIYRHKYRKENSRALKYEALHTKVGGLHDPMMMSRFCEWSDAVLEYDFKRILTIDSDVALFENVNEAFQGFTEDVVSPCRACSQVVLWTQKSLSNFCDAHIEYLSLESRERIQFYEKYGDPSSIEQQTRWNDMRMLEAFMLEKRFNQGLSSVSQTDERPSERNPLPFVWLAGLTIQAYDLNTIYIRKLFDYKFMNNWGNVDCKYFDILFEFKREEEFKPKFAIYAPANARLPLMHFHQVCKIEYGHRTYLKHYQSDYNYQNNYVHSKSFAKSISAQPAQFVFGSNDTIT
jgi:hypothetical protein